MTFSGPAGSSSFWPLNQLSGVEFRNRSAHKMDSLASDLIRITDNLKEAHHELLINYNGKILFCKII